MSKLIDSQRNAATSTTGYNTGPVLREMQWSGHVAQEESLVLDEDEEVVNCKPTPRETHLGLAYHSNITQRRDGDQDSEPMPATEFSEITNEISSAEKYPDEDMAVASELKSEPQTAFPLSQNKSVTKLG